MAQDRPGAAPPGLPIPAGPPKSAGRPGAGPSTGSVPEGGEGRDDKTGTGEIGGPAGPEPTRYGDWEVGGRCTDF